MPLMMGTFDGIPNMYHDDYISSSKAMSQGIVAVIHRAGDRATCQHPVFKATLRSSEL